MTAGQSPAWEIAVKNESQRSMWEIVDDDGFIFKRHKRRAETHDASGGSCRDTSTSRRGEPSDRDASSRRETLKFLLAQKAKYSAEISDWEILLGEQGEELACSPAPESSVQAENLISNGASIELEEDEDILQMKVEACEAINRKLQILRDQGESMCRQLEKDAERNHKHLEDDLLSEINKFTPRTIINALTTETALPFSARDLRMRSLLGQKNGEFP